MSFGVLDVPETIQVCVKIRMTHLRNLRVGQT